MQRLNMMRAITEYCDFKTIIANPQTGEKQIEIRPQNDSKPILNKKPTLMKFCTNSYKQV